ncbi:MAG: flavodoxin family protein, partial [Oscillospiraceae bacterium]|nr:flavodoxin family protein [Oscillospiraceae bacterium]
MIGLNGSPRKDGNTAQMLGSALSVCEAAGYRTELYQAGGRAVYGCKACGGCGKHVGRCATDDWVNEVYAKFCEADAILIGTPTYFADL